MFLDMYWQNLAAAYCGAGKAKELNSSLKEEYKKKNDRAMEAHHAALEKAWTLIEEGKKKGLSGQHQVELGNLQLLWIEQHDILQKLMYESEEAKIVNRLGIMNHFARGELRQKIDSKLMTFDEFSKTYKHPNNLSDFNSRYAWMKYIITKQTDYIHKAEKQGLLEALYIDNLQDALEILEPYIKK